VAKEFVCTIDKVNDHLVAVNADLIQSQLTLTYPNLCGLNLDTGFFHVTFDKFPGGEGVITTAR